MDKNNFSKFYFNDYQINTMSFNINPDFKGKDVQLDFNIEANIAVDENKNRANISLKLVLWDNPEKNNYPFKAEIDILGSFSAEEEMEKEEFYNMCRYSGTATLFPFLRGALADVTKASNFGPSIILPLINVNKFVENSMK